MQGKLFVISGPSGSGKTTAVNKIIHDYKGKKGLSRIVTYTSRPPRKGEVQGKDYYFMTTAEFEILHKNNFFLIVSNIYGYRYGVSQEIMNVLIKEDSFFIIVDRAGAGELNQKIKNVVLIWIAPPCYEALEERVFKRHADSLHDIKHRLVQAEHELKQEHYDPFYTYHIVNEKIDQTVALLKEILIKELNVSNKDFIQ